MSRVKVKFHSFPHYFYLTWRCKIFCDNQRIKFERKLAHNWLIILWSDNLESKLWSPKCTKCTQNSILSVFRLFFGRIEKTINCYRDLLTFNVRSEKKYTKPVSNTLLRLAFFFSERTLTLLGSIQVNQNKVYKKNIYYWMIYMSSKIVKSFFYRFRQNNQMTKSL